MPLTAQHEHGRVIDLTSAMVGSTHEDDELLPGVTWDHIYKVRPRAPLKCRECSHGLHAKVSRGGMRFFAHDANAPECGLAGESLAHRLLKVELASAIRAAGWQAELEVAGDGWRADVLATSPDGSQRMAWEAQLAAATATELQERTARMAAESVSVCWVTDKDRPYIGHVPAIRIQADTTTESTPQVTTSRRAPAVVDGLSAFLPNWCQPRGRCMTSSRTGRYTDGGPCGGHGHWIRPETELDLSEFVTHVLARNLAAHKARTVSLIPLGRHEPGPIVWTTHMHAAAEHEQLEATAHAEKVRAIREQQEARRREAAAQHRASTNALLARQHALQTPAVSLLERETKGVVGVRNAAEEWAMGVPLFVHDIPRGVIAPVASRIEGEVRERLSTITIFVATPTERDRIAKATTLGQRIELIEVEVDVDAFVLSRVQAREARTRSARSIVTGRSRQIW